MTNNSKNNVYFGSKYIDLTYDPKQECYHNDPINFVEDSIGQ